MIRTPRLIAAAALTVLAILGYAATAIASSTRASCTVTYVGNSWGPVPVWRITNDDGSTVDVQQTDAPTCTTTTTAPTTTTTSSAPAPSSTTTTATAPAATTTTAPAAPAASPEALYLINSASVVEVGSSWGSLPTWRVTVIPLHMSVDVNAADEQGARQAALPSVIDALAQAQAAPAPSGSSSPSTGTGPATAPSSSSPATAPSSAPTSIPPASVPSASGTGAVTASSGVYVTASPGVPGWHLVMVGYLPRGVLILF